MDRPGQTTPERYSTGSRPRPQAVQPVGGEIRSGRWVVDHRVGHAARRALEQQQLRGVGGADERDGGVDRAVAVQRGVDGFSGVAGVAVVRLPVPGR